MKPGSVALTAIAALLVSATAVAGTGAIAQHDIPTAGARPVSVVSGPDGALWFTEFAGNKIGRLTTDGAFDEYAIPTLNARPDDMAVGPDGNLWFAETTGNAIGRITPSGAISEFGPLPAGSFPTAVAPGSDGNVWFTERWFGSAGSPATGKVGRVTPSGVITEYSAGITGHPLTIASGPDGAVWFTESPGNKIGRIEPATGSVEEYTVPTAQSAPWEITAGPDDNLWFTEINADKIGRVTTDGVFTEYSIPTPGSMPNTIRPGPDPNAADDCAYQREALGAARFVERYGNFGGCVSSLATTKTLWFSEQHADRVAQITVDGDIFEFPVAPASVPGGLTGGPDDAVWIAALSGNRIDRLDVKSVGKPAAPGQDPAAAGPSPR